MELPVVYMEMGFTVEKLLFVCMCVCVYVTVCSNVVQFDTVRPGCGNSLPVPVAQSDTIKIL